MESPLAWGAVHERFLYIGALYSYARAHFHEVYTARRFAMLELMRVPRLS